jgi:cystathionine beta-lyase/cystathionine gamma-synthase
VAAGRKRKGDAELVQALAMGASAENAAQKAGVSRRTVCRRLADPAFRTRVAEARAEIVRREAGLLTAAGMAAIKALTTLLESATSESVKLGAARTTLEMGCKLRETVEWTDRLAALEGRLNALLGSADRLEDC